MARGPGLRCQTAFVLKFWDSAGWDGLGVLAWTVCPICAAEDRWLLGVFYPV